MIEVVQIVTFVALVLGLFWQQQRVFDRLGIRMDARFDKLETKLDARFDKLETKLDARFDEIDECLARIEGRLGIMPTPQPTAASTE